MKNSIKITMPFSFKGIEHTPSTVIDLDTFVNSKKEDFRSAFHLIATENNIGNYSYEYEVLESSPQIFSDPTGIAKEFLSEGCFDLEGFKMQVVEGDGLKKVQSIAKEFLNIDDIESDQNIKQALLKAYMAGKADS